MKNLITSCAAMLLCTTAYAGHPETSVSSDGYSTPRQASESEAAVISGPYFGDSSLSLEDVGARPVLDGELDLIRDIPVMTAPIPPEWRKQVPTQPAQEAVTPESVINIDTRTKVDPYDSASASSFPARSVVLITFLKNDGSSSRCSGWMINRNTVATAGHCVHEGYDGNFFPTGSYIIYPGYTGASAPYGSCSATNLYTVVGWADTGSWNNWEYDFGGIKLNCTVGLSTGFMSSASPNRPRQQNTLINGYPGDKPLEQWMSADRVRQFLPATAPFRKIWYANDTTGGMSGSPIWNDSGSAAAPVAVGVHAYATDASGWNSGTIFNDARIDTLNGWRAD